MKQAVQYGHTRKPPGRHPWGFSIPTFKREGLTPQAGYRLLIAVQPFDDVVAGHTSRNSDKKWNKHFQYEHPLPVASIGAVTGRVYHKSTIDSIRFFLHSSQLAIMEITGIHDRFVPGPMDIYNRGFSDIAEKNEPFRPILDIYFLLLKSTFRYIKISGKPYKITMSLTLAKSRNRKPL